MTKIQKEKLNISKNLKKLEEVVDWFKNQEEVDVEAGLDKLKEAVPILKGLKSRLKEVENEFEEIKQDLEDSVDSVGDEDGGPKDIPF